MDPNAATARDARPRPRASRWALKLGRFAGIDVYVHATFGLLIAWFAYDEWRRSGSLEGVAPGLALVIAVFGCVVLHEFGHALTARRFGVQTRDITLYPIGGVARLERFPEKPRQEFLIAIAGPAVNFAIAGILFGVLAVLGRLNLEGALDVRGGSFLVQLMLLNVVIGAFNMAPAFPMDGGRVLRAALAAKLGYLRATKIAAAIGQTAAVALGIAGFFGNPLWLLIAVFVWFAAGQEANAVRMKALITGVPVHAIMVREFTSVQADATLGEALDRLLAGSQQDFPVAQGNQVVGVLTRKDLLAALEQRGKGARVREIMIEPEDPVEAYDAATGALQRLSAGVALIPVVHHEKLVGLLTSENLAEFLAAAEALKGREAHKSA